MLIVDLKAVTPDKVIDIGTVCEEIKITWELEGNCGSLETSYLPKHRVDLEEGDCVDLTVNGQHMFKGWVFKKDISAYGTVKLKIYDLKRYLAYKDVDITGNETIDQFFTRICGVANLKHRVIHTSNFIIPTKIHDGETYNNMLQYAIDQTFIGTDRNQLFCVRANGDVLELIDCYQQAQETTVVIGDKTLMTDFQYSSDIENTYNVFKIQREVPSEKDKKLSATDQVLLRTTRTGKNTTNMDRWGALQYYEKKDSKWTNQQLDEHLKHVMEVYGRKTRTLKISALGDTYCIPGNGINLAIGDLVAEGVPAVKYALITSATHTIINNLHTMELTVEVPQL